ncbi:MAG: HAD-IIIA family hydrolase [Bacteroidales bacterium]|jgi:3-deoxy-D-manno-octulosonate 8-phosphate phosphatase (KDO 8-P phosphatase)|nr:HAD-IIIA family hydrolase [Bacteroidales bacterium]MDD4258032.1 HAD-IIIA family hydrolase [Bacteroidales bacterium]MDD4654364.1 HAD-IIIA family hydrolase [Bacteroidales bacterium]MDD4828747.1 HAD-IIIA family hydrolase [Bacteroidales bacterium]HPS25673.1 HAD-IIIA family hydrolase [Bacteroidales bacterium]
MSNYKSLLRNIKAFAFDVDGVLTDGGVISMPDGDLLRTHYARDGYAIRMAVEHGYPVAIITGGVSPAVALRYKNIGVKDIYSGARDKLPFFMDFCHKYGLEPSQVAYAGDDIPDIPPMEACGLPFCPSDAAMEVRKISHYISPFPGGRGCVRDLIEQVMRLKGQWYDSTVISE